MPDILPNCIGKTPKAMNFANGCWEVFCANCGTIVFYAQVTEVPAEYAFSLCNDCVEKYGEPAGFMKTPDEIFWDRCRDAMLEDYGKVLTTDEILVELDHPSSVVSMLERDGQRRR